MIDLKIWERFAISMSMVCIAIVIVFCGHRAQGQVKAVQGHDIIFTGKNWKEVTAMARKQHKKIFLDAYASWCAPCKQLKHSTFKDQRVGTYFNQHFINVSVDIEKGEGKILGEKFEISAYPTLILLNEDGTVIVRSEGFLNAKELLALFAEDNQPSAPL